ncbi:leucine-rich repeat domain-containing protein [Pseudomonas fakonensis]|uniref:Leucine-rich repeat domain-containing protein n=1 Tax=Pseudomonas fakonensis TaxID=2842355 RepID=A0ABX8N045_9PSED|nr:NEL-type E3 ubiquitin ligase domain-containing protein [Pseudomonas fakonensis]QXH49716.1 leucine-rich repeat domain-containing protein [Pseudomonas fakonensis]
MTPPPIAPDSIDGLIAHRLPAWLTSASDEQRDALQHALLEQQQAQDKLAALLGEVHALDDYAQDELRQALQAVGPTLDVHKSVLKRTWWQIPPQLSPSLSNPPIHRQSQQSLLACALHNFEAHEATLAQCQVLDASGAPMSFVDSEGKTKPLTPELFAKACRELDIGGRYQAYLGRRFSPDDAPKRDALHQQLQAVLRTNLTARLHLARLTGDLDEQGYRLLLALVSTSATVPAETAVLKPFSLRLLGKPVVGPVVFEIRQSAKPGAKLEGLIAWLPGDPHLQLGQHASWERFYQGLGKRFRKPGYAAFFQRFIGEADRAGFSQVLAGLLAEAGDTAIELDGRSEAISGELFVHLRKAQVDKIFGDAQVLAVPTEKADSAAREARLQGYLELGLDLFNLAGLFVPGLGLAMLGVAALQLTYELYEGYEDWTLGDREGALGHVFAVAANVAAMAALHVGVKAAGKVLERVGFVDELVAVQGEDGQMRLCDPGLAAYRLPEADDAPDAMDAGRLRLQGGRYQVSRETAGAPWRIEHPSRPGAYRPALLDNGAGGWRHALESPQHWQGAGQLVRRLGPELAEVGDAAAEHVAEATGFDEARLRRLHLEQAPAPARLLDALERHRLYAASPRLGSMALAQQLAALQPTTTAAGRLLLRDFPGLTPRCAEEIAGQASSELQQRLLSTSRVPLALAERARWALRDSRVDRALAGLRQHAAGNADTCCLALTLGDQLAPWADAVRLELRDGRAGGPLLAAQGATETTDVRQVVKGEDGYLALDAQGKPLAGASAADSLAQALLLHMDLAQRLGLGVPELSGEQFEQAIMQRAAADREAVARAIGMAPVGGNVRPPVRLGDGRLGYPLSGHGKFGLRAAYHVLKRIYPTLTDDQAYLFVNERIQEQVNVWSRLSLLQQQLTTLKSGLLAWQQTAEAGLRRSRARVARQLLAGWRLQSMRSASAEVHLRIEGEVVGGLPSLAAPLRFDNVTHLTLRRLGLTELAPTFIGRFSRLQHLDLGGNRLGEIPPALAQLPQLRSLVLADNRIVLSTQGNNVLAGLTQLRQLNLSRNALVAGPRLTGLRHLRQVNLRSTGLTEVPEGLVQQANLEFADLRNNRITHLDAAYYTQPARLLARIHLHDNPLDAVSEARRHSFERGAVERPRSLAAHAALGDANRDAWLAMLETDQRLPRQLQWNALSAEPGSEDLFQLLADLHDTEDYRRQSGELGRRVWEVLEACEQNTELRQRLFELAGEPTSCSDSVSLVFSQLEVQSWVHLRTAGLEGQAAEAELMRLGRSLFRLDEVDKAAAEDIQERLEDDEQDVDEIEVRLAYRVRLAETLGLPGQPQAMRYGVAAGVSGKRLLQVRGQVLVAERSARQGQSLMQRPFWQAYLRKAYAERFNACDQPFYDQLEALGARAGSLKEWEYLKQSDEVGAAREVAQTALIETLTDEAFVRYPL